MKMKTGLGYGPEQKPDPIQRPGITGKASPEVLATFFAEERGEQDVEDVFKQEEPREEELLSLEEDYDEDEAHREKDLEEKDLFVAGEPFLGKGFRITWLWMPPHLVWCLPFSGPGMRGFDRRENLRRQLETLFRAFEEHEKLKTYFPAVPAPVFFRHMLVSYFFALESAPEGEDKKATDDLKRCGVALYGAKEPFMEGRDFLRTRGGKKTDVLPFDRGFLWLREEFELQKGFPLADVLEKGSFWSNYGSDVVSIWNDFRAEISLLFQKAFDPSREYLTPLAENTLKNRLWELRAVHAMLMPKETS